MYFKFSGRTNPKTKSYDSYYRLVESYRNAEGRVGHRTILNIGFIDEELSAEQLSILARILTDIYERKEVQPFTKLKSVVHKMKPKKSKPQQIRAISSG